MKKGLTFSLMNDYKQVKFALFYMHKRRTTARIF